MIDTPETTPAQLAVDTPPAAATADNKEQAVAAGETTTIKSATEAAREETGQPVESNDQAQSPQAAAAAAAAAAATMPLVVTPSQSSQTLDALTAARAGAEWRVIGETVPGASHLRAGLPNQDAIMHVRQSSMRLPLIVSISDGHGSNKCFRSDRGARFAVRIGCDLLDELINGRHAALAPAEIENKVRESLTNEFIKRWRAAVEADLRREPFREEEFARMIEKDGARARPLVEANPSLAYGATSLSFLLTPTYALYLQLGDGEMVNVSASGEVSWPLPDDARLLANETTSLCLDKAAGDFRFVVRPHGEADLPALILLTTDGYYNSFSTTAGFNQVGGDLLHMLREADGFATVSRSLKGWLEEATASGSGDDCTLAIICRMDALTATATSTDPLPATASSDAPTAPAASAVTPTLDASHEQSATPKIA